MYLNPNKSELDNFYDLLTEGTNIGQRLDAGVVDVATTVSSIGPTAGNNFSNSQVLVTGKAGSQFEQLGSALAVFRRHTLDGFQGRHGSKIFITNDDTQESIIQKICDRLKVPRYAVVLVGTLPRLPTGRGLEAATVTLAPAVSGNNSRINIVGNIVFTVVNNGPLRLPLQPTLYFGAFYVNRAVTLFDSTAITLSVYNTTALTGAPTFDNTIHGDENRSVNDSFILWLNNLLAPEARRWCAFTPENTQLVGIYATTIGSSIYEFFVRGNNEESPVTLVNGVGFRLTIKNYETAAFRNVPQWLIACEDIESAREPVRKYLKLPHNQFTITSFSKAAGTNIITINGTNNQPCPAMPRVGSLSMTFNPV